MTLCITENISLLSLFANYIKQAAHLCFGNNVTCYMSAIHTADNSVHFYIDISFSPCLADVLILHASQLN